MVDNNVELGADSSPSERETRLLCPCGELLVGASEDALVTLAQEHLSQRHPGLEYSRDEILFLAY